MPIFYNSSFILQLLSSGNYNTPTSALVVFSGELSVNLLRKQLSMSSFDLPIGSFAFLMVGKTGFLVKRLGVSPFDPNTADVGVHFTVSERYAKKVILKFNFPIRIGIAIPHCHDVASLYLIGFSVA